MNGKRQDLRYREVPKPYSLYLYDAKIGPIEDKVEKLPIRGMRLRSQSRDKVGPEQKQNRVR